MRPLLRGSLLVAAMLTSGCATAGRVGGTAGPVEWEVVDVGRVDAVDGNRSRWSYTIVLKERVGVPIQFERIDRGAHGQTLETGDTARIAFNRRLEANGELRHHTADTWGWVAGRAPPQFGGISPLGALTVEKHFVGKDPQGHAVVVPVRVVLDRSFGRASRQPARSEPPTPPAQSRQPQDLKTLAGRWEGYYRASDFQIPIEAVIGDDGSVEFGENDPVTNRFRRMLSVREGRVSYVATGDTAEFTYHEGGGRRVLAGHLGLGTSGAGSDRFPIWLERTGSALARVTPPVPTSAGLPPGVQAAFATYRSDPKYGHFKAFAVDRASGAWGRAWSQSSAAAAMDRALAECGKRAAACEAYAVGDTVLASVSPDQRSAIVLGGAQLTYKGVLTTERAGRVETSPVSFKLFPGRTELIGSWSRDDPPLSGVISGGALDTNQATVRMTQSHPCRAEFTGVVSIGEGGKTLDATYTGPGCDGVPLKATFAGERQ